MSNDSMIFCNECFARNPHGSKICAECGGGLSFGRKMADFVGYKRGRVTQRSLPGKLSIGRLLLVCFLTLLVAFFAGAVTDAFWYKLFGSDFDKIAYDLCSKMHDCSTIFSSYHAKVVFMAIWGGGVWLLRGFWHSAP